MGLGVGAELQSIHNLLLPYKQTLGGCCVYVVVLFEGPAATALEEDTAARTVSYAPGDLGRNLWKFSEFVFFVFFHL